MNAVAHPVRNALAGTLTVLILTGGVPTTGAVETPTAVVFDDISTHSITASAYAPTPAFSNLELGLSGTDIAIDGNYAAWHSPGNIWTTKAPMITARHMAAAAVVGGRIYVMGGPTGNSLTTTDVNEEYDPATNSWAVKAPMPAVRLSLTAAAVGTRIYAMGGGTAFLVGLSNNYEYDVEANAWATKAPMPTGRQDLAAAALDGKVYAMGGNTLSGIVGANEVYDPATDTWAAASSMPTPRGNFVAAAVDGGIYAMVGNSASNTYTTTNERYHPGTDSWATKAPAPTARYTHSGAVAGGKVFILAGTSATGDVSAADEYDPSADTWTTRAPIPTLRNNAVAAAVAGKVHVMGGSVGATVHSANEQYDPGVTTPFASLIPNTLYAFKAKARDSAGVETPESPTFSTYTLAATPANLAVAAASSMTVSLTWSANGNPAGTVYEIFRSTGGPFSLRSSQTTAFTTDSGLTPLTNYSYEVRAINGDFIATAFTAIVSTQTSAPAPAAPTSFSGVAISPDSIRWIWADNAANEAGYRVLSGTVSVSGDLAANTTTWLQAGLSTNTLHGPFLVQAFNAGGTADSNTASRATLAAAPADLVVSGVSSTTVSLAWSANGNPGGTLYELQRSTGGPFVFLSTETATAVTDGGLTPLALYQYQVRAINGDAVATAFTAIVSTQAGNPDPPVAPASFAGAATSTTEIRWTWIDNADNEAGYRVLSGTVSVSGDLAANTTTWLQAGLSTNTLHGPFLAQAFNAGGTADSDTASRATLAAAPADLVVSGVSSTTVSLAWSANGNPGGTLYELQRSTGGPFVFLSTETATAVTDGGLTPLALYQYQVRAINGDAVATAFTATVSTQTSAPPIETPTAVVFDDISTHSITASAYAPTPAFSNLELGLSGTDVAIDGNYAAWHSPGNQWTAKTAMPTARYAPGLATVGGKIYAMGGNQSGPLNANDEYDPASNTWATKASMPTSRDTLAAVSVDGKVYAIGGAGSSVYFAVNEEYDPTSNTWTPKAPMPTVRYGLMAAVVGGKIYAVGGADFTSLHSSNEEYDPQSNTWAIKAPMPTARRHPAGAAVGDKIFVLGGNDNSIARNDNEAYDPSSNTWAVRAPMPTGRDSLAAAAVGGKIHAVGGFNGSYLATNEEYDPANNAWASRATMPTTRYLLSAAAAGGRVYVMGGYNGSLLASNEEYDPGVATPFAALTPNTLYAFKAKARDSAGVETPESPTFSTYTLAATPANLAVAAVSSMTVSLTWSANGNPAGTVYELFRSTGGPFSLRSSQTTALTTDSGLTPLTNYSYKVRAINGDFIATAFTAFVSTQTSAPEAPEAPTGFAGAATSTTEIRWTWSDSADDEAGYRVLSGTVNVSGDMAANTTTWLQTGLSTNTLYGPFLVQAFNSGGTADSNSASRTTLAAPPADLVVTGTSSTTASLAWSPNGNPGGTLYELQRSTGGPFAFLSTGTATAVTDAGLAPLTTYQYQVRAFNGESVATAFSNQVSTAAAPPDVPGAPTGFGGSALATSQINWTWSDNADNESGYRVLSGTANVSGDLSADATSWLQTGLSTNTLYGPYFVQAFGAGGTADSNSASRTTLAAPPANLDVTAVSSTTVALAWAANGNPGGTLYELQRSTGGPFAFQSTGTATSFTDTGLTPQTTYQYQVRAFNEESTATAFSSQVSTVTSPPPAATVSAVLKNPKDGKKIHGNHVAVKAELVLGTAAQTLNVLFQYKDSTSSVWIDIVAAGNDLNPDPSSPYAISWDLTLLPPGNYNLRAVATSLTGTVDPSPQTVTIINDPSGPNQQNLSANGDEQRSQTVNNGEEDDIVIAVEGNEFISLVIPAGAINVGTATITVKLPARGSKTAAAAVQDASETFSAEVGISFEEPEAALAPGQVMMLTFSYDDSVAGVLGLTTSRTGPPALYSYEAASASWRRESASGIDSNSRTVSALISHAGVFALRTPAAAATAAADLSQVRVYPMPYKPNGGDPDHGARFDAGDPNSGIIFDNLTQQTTIKIYTASGQLVISFDSNAPTGRIQWDARNGSGRDVASGFYIAVITSPGQPALVKRMLIIR